MSCGPTDPQYGISVDQYGRVLVHLFPPGATITFEFTPAEMREMAGKLLEAAMDTEAMVVPVVEAAIAKARGSIQ